MLDLAGGLQTPLTQFHIGDAVELPATALAAGPVTIRKPDGSEVRLTAGEKRFAQTDLPGIYAVSSVQPPVSFVVNLDPAESRTAPLPVDQLEQLGVPLKPQQVNTATQVELKRRLHDNELEDQQKLWRWLTFAAVVVLLVETWLAGWLTRRPIIGSRGWNMMDRVLKSHLQPIARRWQQCQLWRALAWCWAALGLLGLVFLLVHHYTLWSSLFTFPLLLIASIAVVGWTVWHLQKTLPDYRELARQIESDNPQLHALLLTAIEQQPAAGTGELNYLQQRVIDEALAAHQGSPWGKRLAEQLFCRPLRPLAELRALCRGAHRADPQPPACRHPLGAKIQRHLHHPRGHCHGARRRSRRHGQV